MRHFRATYLVILMILISLCQPLDALSTGSDQIIETNDYECGPDNPVFNISMISPNTYHPRNEWASLMETEFPKACIGINEHLNTDWTTIAARSWSTGGLSGYIPTYDEGGFDILFLGFSNGELLDLPYATYFNECSDICYGFDLIKNWNNDTFDEIYDEFMQSTDYNIMENLAFQLQNIWYQDQPTLTILQDSDLWLYADTILDDETVRGLNIVNLGDDWKRIGGNFSSNTYAHHYSISEFIPQVANSYISNQYINSVWQGLYTRDLNTKRYIPLLANNMPIWLDDDYTVANIELRTDITFADGHVMDMEDVVESFKRIFDPNYQDIMYSTYINYFGNPNNDDLDNYRPMDQMYNIIDNSTIQFNLTKPYFPAEKLFSFPILPTHTWGPSDAPSVSNYDFNTALLNNPSGPLGLGSGPFRYSEINMDTDIITLVANNNYWNGSVNLDRISFKSYTNKSLVLSGLIQQSIHIVDKNFHLTFQDINNLLDNYSFNIVANNNWHDINLNLYHPIFGSGYQTPLGVENPDKAHIAARYVRQAMSHAIPRQEIIDGILDGIGISGITPWSPESLFFNDNLEPYEYNIQRAKQLLAMAGYHTGVEDENENMVNPIDTPRQVASQNAGPFFKIGPSIIETIGFVLVPVLVYYIFTKGRNYS